LKKSVSYRFSHGIPPEVEVFQDELRSRLDDETRRVILRLKEAWHTRPEYPEVIGAFEICTAVLAGVRTEGDLEARLWQAARRRIPGLSG